MFKKINIKILYATIALTFSVNLLIDGVIMRGIREGDSCRVFAERIQAIKPCTANTTKIAYCNEVMP